MYSRSHFKVKCWKWKCLNAKLESSIRTDLNALSDDFNSETAAVADAAANCYGQLLVCSFQLGYIVILYMASSWLNYQNDIWYKNNILLLRNILFALYPPDKLFWTLANNRSKSAEIMSLKELYSKDIDIYQAFKSRTLLSVIITLQMSLKRLHAFYSFGRICISTTVMWRGRYFISHKAECF